MTVTGIIMALGLQLLDFALSGRMVNAHTLWHLGIAIPIIWWYKLAVHLGLLYPMIVS